MRNCPVLLIAGILISLSVYKYSCGGVLPGFAKVRSVTSEDYKNFYSHKNLQRLGIALGIGALIANTNGDTWVRNRYQRLIRCRQTDSFSSIVKNFGEGRLSVPMFCAAALAGRFFEGGEPATTIGKWGTLSLRAIVVGAPPLIFFQNALGASRPVENDSTWRPFQDNNGISGHSFMGAVPFITAAQMTKMIYLKSLLYFASGLCGWSRINDDAHYFSQAVLGWYLAYLSCKSLTSKTYKRLTFAPMLIRHGLGLMICIEF